VKISPNFFSWAMKKRLLGDELPALGDIPHAGEVIPAGRPLLTVFASAESLALCEAQLAERAACVERQLLGQQLQLQQ
jgi:predicted ATP-grasp superfamily ATP-dependent carboligase